MNPTKRFQTKRHRIKLLSSCTFSMLWDSVITRVWEYEDRVYLQVHVHTWCKSERARLLSFLSLLAIPLTPTRLWPIFQSEAGGSNPEAALSYREEESKGFWENTRILPLVSSPLAALPVEEICNHLKTQGEPWKMFTAYNFLNDHRNLSRNTWNLLKDHLKVHVTSSRSSGNCIVLMTSSRSSANSLRSMWPHQGALETL